MKNRTVFVAGHRGLVGQALLRRLKRDGISPLVADRNQLDLRDPAATESFLARNRPDYIFNAAARVGGIAANMASPASFLYDNLAIAGSLIHGAHRAGVQRMLLMGSSCIYPRECKQPIREDYLLTGPLEKTNEPYAIAKIAGLKMAEAYNREYGRDFVSVMPTNLYGPGDNFDPETSHVLAALLARIDHAKNAKKPAVTVWGSGTPRREFLYVDDLADACVFLMNTDTNGGMYNVGTGSDLEISALARKIASVVGYDGAFAFDRTKPDGTPAKRLDVSRLRELGWESVTDLDSGLVRTYGWYKKEYQSQVPTRA